jgi:hypothetical protein
MALKVERRGGVVTTTSLQKPNLCHTCGQRKPGLFTVDAYNKPLCSDCARAQKRDVG